MSRLTASSPWYREPWPWILMTGPFVVIVAGAITIWLAVTTSDGLVADDYYKQGLAINQQLEKDRHAAALGVRGELVRSGRELRLFLAGNTGLVLPEELKLRVVHPTRGGLDQLVMLKSEGAGLYGGRLSNDVVGHWRVMLADEVAGWRLVGEWNADTGEPLKLAAETK